MQRRTRSLVLTALAAASALVLSACGGGASDDVKSPENAAAVTSGSGTDAPVDPAALNLIAYAVPKVGFDLLIPGFQATEAGKGVTFAQSYGASGDQSRKVADGAPADVVNFSVTPDITRLVDAGLVDADWNAGEHGGIPFGSVVTLVTREGNPLGIKDWDDLLKDGVEVISPNPQSSGSAKWNLLAPYAAKSDGGKNPEAGLAFVKSLVTDHFRVRPKSGREASEAFLQGQGDVLISYENEAIFLKEQGEKGINEKIEYVNPPVTFKIENPVAVLNNSTHAAQAKAFVDYLFTPAAQQLWADAGFRPVDPAVFKTNEAKFPAGEKIWNIDDLGGWGTVDPQLFKAETGAISKIYDEATS
ncbi:sulfate ABC transporter substrate-binding protein [Nakamurella silvestris]|nr:sulfate ABC transporter substrate-binding protein [Nakamurella silvestris]